MDTDDHRWGSLAVDPNEKSLPGLKAEFLVANAPRQGRLIEIGSGDGKMLRTLHLHAPELELHGTDIRTPPTPPECYAFHPSVGGAIPAALDGTFDAVALMDVLEHVPDPASLLRDAARLLRPGGLLLAFVPVEGELVSAYSFFRVVLGSNVYVETKDHVQAFKHSELERLVRARFTIEERRYAYHGVGQTMDAAFFAAHRLRSLQLFWRKDNAFYHGDKPSSQGAGTRALNMALRVGNAVAWAESTVLSRVRAGSAGVLLRARREEGAS